MTCPSRLILSSWILVAHRHQDECGGRQASIDATQLQPTFPPQPFSATYGAACVVCACVGRTRRMSRAMATLGCRGERHAHRHHDESGGRQASIDATLLHPTFPPQASLAIFGAACVVCACAGRTRRMSRAMATLGCRGERHAHRHRDESGGRQASIDATLLHPTLPAQASLAIFGAACVVCACAGRTRHVGRATATELRAQQADFRGGCG